MKAKLFTAILASVVLFSSCKKDPVVPDGQDTADKKTAAMINGTSFSSVSTVAVANVSDNAFVLTAKDKDDNSIMITGPTETGTFNNANGNGVSGSFIDSQGAVWMSSFGGNVTLTITKFDKTAKKISGNFSFTATAVETSSATGTKTVTGGTFTDVSYIQ